MEGYSPFQSHRGEQCRRWRRDPAAEAKLPSRHGQCSAAPTLFSRDHLPVWICSPIAVTPQSRQPLFLLGTLISAESPSHDKEAKPMTSFVTSLFSSWYKNNTHRSEKLVTLKHYQPTVEQKVWTLRGQGWHSQSSPEELMVQAQNQRVLWAGPCSADSGQSETEGLVTTRDCCWAQVY